MLKFLFRVSLVALSALAIVGCTTVDDTLGLEFVPDNQKTTVVWDEFSGINCYLTQTDSIPSNNLGVAFFGTTKSATFGETEASVILQYLPGGFKDKDKGFGYLPMADTLKLYWALSSFSGTPIADGQEFVIYAVKEKIVTDTTYYTNFDCAEISESDPIFEFTYKNNEKEYLDLKPVGEKGEKFLQSLIDQEKATYETDSVFHKTFKGFYVTPKADANKDKEIFCVGLEDSHLLLIGHNHDKDKVVGGIPAGDGSDNKDTVSMAFYFDDSQYSLNTSINRIRHSYVGTPIAHINDTTVTATPVTTAYVQTLAGVTTYLRFTDEFVNDILETKLYDREQYKNMVINKAEIRFYLDDATTPLMNAAPKRLGMFYNYRKLVGIPDYAYQYEQQGSTLPYGGYLNRSLGYYSMDITSYIQQLMINPKIQRTVYLCPDVALTYSFGEVTLKAPATDPDNIKVRLTYTLIK